MQSVKAVLIFSLLISLIDGELHFTISQSWDGIELDAHDDVHIMLSYQDGYLYIEVSNCEELSTSITLMI